MSLRIDRPASNAPLTGALSRGDSIPVDGESVTSFVGPTPRGPVDQAIELHSTSEFEKIFGVPAFHCRMESAVRQFFANGGRYCVVVRVCGSSARNRIRLPGAAGDLLLEARNPGPLEFLRASIDYDGIPQDAVQSFNLIVQRLRAPESAWIDTQECFRGISVDPGSRDFVGRVLEQSELVRLAAAKTFDQRPAATIKSGSIRQAGYIPALTGQRLNPPPTDYDLIGSESQGTGLSALKDVNDLGQLCLISGAVDGAIGPVALLAAERFCRTRQCLLIIDPPAHWITVEDVLADQYRSDFSSPNAVTWFPGVWTRAANGERINTSSVGAVAAVLVVAHRTRALPKLAPASLTMLRSSTRLDADVTQEDVHRLARVGINTLLRRNALHMNLCGDVTQARHSNVSGGCDGLEARRDVLFILRRLRLGTHWAQRYESTPQLWKELVQQISEFLTTLHRETVLHGVRADLSFHVRCDSQCNKSAQGKSGDVTFVIGIAIRKPGEYLCFRFHHSASGCRITELGWQSDLALTG